jgi:hypothetical protein
MTAQETNVEEGLRKTSTLTGQQTKSGQKNLEQFITT